MEVLQIDLKGKMAHFRKYYANNTAMSFSIPPRTTLMGMIATMIGLPKDEYYRQLASDRIRIGVVLCSPIKKSFSRLNYLSVKSIGNIKNDLEKEKPFTTDFRGTGGRIQTPFEIITGNNIRQDEVWYRMYVSYFEDGKDLFNHLKNCVLARSVYYNLSFGIAGFSAYITHAQYYDNTMIEQNETNLKSIEFNSAIISNKISSLEFARKDEYSFIEEELMPADFTDNHNRELAAMNRVLFTHNSLPLKVAYTGKYYILNQTTTIAFLEND